MGSMSSSSNNNQASIGVKINLMLREHEFNDGLFDFNKPRGDLRSWHFYKPPEYFSLIERTPYEQVAGQVRFTMVATEKELDRVAVYRELSAETLVS